MTRHQVPEPRQRLTASRRFIAYIGKEPRILCEGYQT